MVHKVVFVVLLIFIRFDIVSAKKESKPPLKSAVRGYLVEKRKLPPCK